MTEPKPPEIDDDEPGTEFFDEETGRDCKLVYNGAYSRWIFARDDAAGWLPWRKATIDDLVRITTMMVDGQSQGRLTDPKVLPQRFQYKKRGDDRWHFGCCVPQPPVMTRTGPIEPWRILVADISYGFDETPWEILGQLIGDVTHFRWIDNDYAWHPRGVVCCDREFRTVAAYEHHVRSSH